MTGDATSQALDLARPHAIAIRLQQVRGEINARFIEIAELLREVHQQHYWRDLGYVSFEAFVEEQLDMKYRTAIYLADIFHVLIEQLNVPKEEIAEIGWTKCKELLPVINEENKAELLETAKTHTTNELNLIIRQKQAPPGQAETLRQYSQMTIGMFDDERVQIEEALELGKLESGSDRAATALLYICADYLMEAKARQAQAVPPEKGTHELRSIFSKKSDS